MLASSGKARHVEAFLDLIDGKSLADAWTTSDDVEKSKPEPDIVSAALAKVEGASGIMVGDSIYDAQAAAKLNIPTLGVRTGGFSVSELQEVGVLQVFDSLVAFRYALDGTPPGSRQQVTAPLGCGPEPLGRLTALRETGVDHV